MKDGRAVVYAGILVIVLIIIAAAGWMGAFTGQRGIGITGAIPEGISVQPASQAVPVGSTVRVDAYVKGVSDVKGVQFDLSYDPNILEVVNVYEGGYLKSDGRETFWVTPDFSTAGVVQHLAAVIIGKGQGIGGEGAFATIEFRAKNPGRSQLTLSGVKMSNSNIQLIPYVALTHGEAIVG